MHRTFFMHVQICRGRDRYRFNFCVIKVIVFDSLQIAVVCLYGCL